MMIGVELEEEEKDILRYPNKFCVYEKLDVGSFELDVETANTKARYHIRNLDMSDKQGEEEVKLNEGEQLQVDRISTESSMIADYVNKAVNMQKQRATDMKENFAGASCLNPGTAVKR